MQKIHWYQGVTRFQWLVLVVAWLGWVFDSMDATIYALVLHPALHELLPGSISGEISQKAIGWYGGLIFSIFLIGWALGGVLFGILADRWGRTRTLVVTILVYALFTGLAALSQTWWHLAIFRFLTALGIGGEWAAGAALVAEVWPDEKRAKAAGLLQSAWAVGFFVAALANLLLQNHSWRSLFLVGLLPAVVALMLRLWVKEPERWRRAREQAAASRLETMVELRQLFSPQLRRSTLVGSGLAFVAVFGLWGATNWAPTLIRSLPDLAQLSASESARYVSYGTMMLNVGALLGYLSFGPLADRFGRRPVFAFMCIGSAVSLPFVFLLPRAFHDVLWLLPLLGFFNNGIFSGFAIYLPELYPTRIRATGAGWCFNVGRVLAAAGPFLTGFLTTALGGFGPAASTIAAIYLVGLAILPFAPETKGKPLPE